MAEERSSRAAQFERAASLLTEYGSYLYLGFLLIDWGESFRNIGIFTAALGWTALAFRRKLRLPHLPVIVFYCLYLLTALVSSALSIDPSYSFGALRSDLLRPTLILLIIATFYDREMLKRTCLVFGVVSLVVLGLGLHGFLTLGTGFYTTETAFLSLDKNEFGFYAVYLLPFLAFCAYRSAGAQRVFWAGVSAWCLLASVLAASRGSIIGLFGMLGLWAAAALGRRHLLRALAAAAIAAAVAAASFSIWPKPLQTTVITLPEHIVTMNQRTDFFWKPAMQAVGKRPLFGWGYGKKLYRDVRPFEGTDKPNWNLRGGLHSTFVTLLFHQGAAGLLAYCGLLVCCGLVLLRLPASVPRDLRLLGVLLAGLVAGGFVLNSLVLNVPLRRLAPLAGMAAALPALRQNSEQEDPDADSDRP
ncbi:MAG: hypothetical protein OHK006_24260 [Thermodesulfovibrionales bacterium]